MELEIKQIMLGAKEEAQRVLDEAKKKAEATLKIEIDEEAFDRLYGHKSHPFEATKGQKVAVRVISQFGEESMKVMEV